MIQTTLRSRKTVWVIDDDETTLLLAEEVLVRAEFNVRVFADAPAALAAAQAALPDIVVVDVMMPGMDGFEFCARLRRLPHGMAIPVLVTTSLDDTASIDRAYQAGATDFATKPLHWAIEVHRLHYLLRSADVARELQQKEHETRLAKEEWERTFNAITDVVTVLDPDLHLLRANSTTAKLLGTAPETLTGRHCYELFHGASQPCPNCTAVRALAANAPVAAELNCGPSGTLYAVTTSPVMDPQGRVTSLVHVARDLSEQKELEAELRQAQKMEAIGTLAGGIAHDFNNLLTVIQGFGEMLNAEEEEAGRVNKRVQPILQAVQRGATLARQLLVFSRKGAAESHKQPLDLNATVQGIRKMLERVLPKTVVIQTRCAPDLRPINADSGQVEQVLMNLSVNAAQAMTNGGTLTIQTQNVKLGPDYCRLHPNARPGDYVLLAVSDTGHGMDKQTQERIYEPFFTTKKVGEGTGLGLSMVFGIVRDHDGYIACYSEVGVGTTFRVYLPALAGLTVPSPQGARDKPAVPRGSETILVVDDEAPVRNLLEQYLTRSGYSVSAVADGAAALQRYVEASARPHAVILDLGMPKMTGWECLERLRRLDPHVRVLVATGYAGSGMATRAFEQGAAGFINKPCNLEDMSRKLRAILDTPRNGGQGTGLPQPHSFGGELPVGGTGGSSPHLRAGE